MFEHKRKDGIGQPVLLHVQKEPRCGQGGPGDGAATHVRLGRETSSIGLGSLTQTRTP